MTGVVAAVTRTGLAGTRVEIEVCREIRYHQVCASDVPLDVRLALRAWLDLTDATEDGTPAVP